jgi:hypothetical protein
MTEHSYFKGRNSNGQKTDEEMLTIPDHEENANQNLYIIIPSHFCSKG